MKLCIVALKVSEYVFFWGHDQLHLLLRQPIWAFSSQIQVTTKHSSFFTCRVSCQCLVRYLTTSIFCLLAICVKQSVTTTHFSTNEIKNRKWSLCQWSLHYLNGLGVTNSIRLAQHELWIARVGSPTLNVNLPLFSQSWKERYGHYRFMMLQIRSLTKWFFIQVSIIYDNISSHNCWDA